MQHASTSEESLRQPDSEAGAVVPSCTEGGADRPARAQEQQLTRSPTGEENWAIQDTTIDVTSQITGNTESYSATTITPTRSSSRQRLVSTTPRYSHRPPVEYGRGYKYQIKDSYPISRDAIIQCEDRQDKVQAQAQHGLTQHLLTRHPNKDGRHHIMSIPSQFASNPHLHHIEEDVSTSLSASHHHGEWLLI